MQLRELRHAERRMALDEKARAAFIQQRRGALPRDGRSADDEEELNRVLNRF